MKLVTKASNTSAFFNTWKQAIKEKEKNIAYKENIYRLLCYWEIKFWKIVGIFSIKQKLFKEK